MLIRAQGLLNVEALERALHILVDRHEILRTRYVREGTEYYQEPVAADFRLPHQDLSRLSEPEKEARLVQTLRAMGARPVSLEDPNALELQRFRLGPREHVLAGFVKHIACDELGSRTLWPELFGFYYSQVLGLTGPAAPPSLQYADFASWERTWMTPRRVAESEARWRQIVADRKALDVTNRAVEGCPSRVERLPVELAPEVWSAALRIARDQRCTAVMVLHAALAVCLSWIAAEERIVFACAISGRPPGTLGLIGCFVQKRPMCIDVRPSDTFLDTLHRTKAANRDVNDLRLAAPDGLMDERDIGRVNVNITQHLGTKGNTERSLGVRFTYEELPEPARLVLRRDLHVSFLVSPFAASGYVHFAADRCDAEKIIRFARILPLVIEEGARSPDSRIDSLLATVATREARERRSIHAEIERSIPAL